MRTAVISRLTFKKKLNYSDTSMVSLNLEYPGVRGLDSAAAERRIARHMEKSRESCVRHATRSLFPEAVKRFRQSLLEKGPFYTSDFITRYEVTLNVPGILSLYIDAHEYTGDSGSTYRLGITRFTKNGLPLTLSDLSGKPERQTKSEILTLILGMARSEKHAGPKPPSQKPPALLKKYYRASNFYLERDGAVIFYQAGDLAPAFDGAATFKIPYASFITEGGAFSLTPKNELMLNAGR